MMIAIKQLLTEQTASAPFYYQLWYIPPLLQTAPFAKKTQNFSVFGPPPTQISAVIITKYIVLHMHMENNQQ